MNSSRKHTIKRITTEGYKSQRTGSPLVKGSRFLIVDQDGKPVDSYKTKAEAERALRLSWK